MIEKGEFGLIKEIAQRFPLKDKRIMGIGDDCAILRANTLISTDALVDGVHFLSDRANPEDIGWKSIAVNVSDIVAMGADPEAILISMGIPESITDSQIDSYMRGVEDASRLYRVDLVGGDTVRSAHWFISVTITGKAFGEPLLRSGAKAGDSLYVSGWLGDSALGLRFIREQGLELKNGEYFRQRHYRPRPRLKLIKNLCEEYKIHSCIDISDGLLSDIGHIADMSKTGYFIDADLLPLSSELMDESIDKESMLELALSGGEDYELLFSTAEELDPAALEEATGVPVTKIGEIKEIGRTINKHGKPVNAEKLIKGFSHF